VLVFKPQVYEAGLNERNMEIYFNNFNENRILVSLGNIIYRNIDYTSVNMN